MHWSILFDIWHNCLGQYVFIYSEPLYVLQKKALRLMIFSKFHEHISPLFKTSNITKLHDLVSYQIAIFMYRYKNRLLPLVFNIFFTEVSEVHQYNTRSAAKQSYYIPKVRTNYGKFNIRYQAPMIWNAINEQVKTGSLSKFKLCLNNIFHYIDDIVLKYCFVHIDIMYPP